MAILTLFSVNMAIFYSQTYCPKQGLASAMSQEAVSNLVKINYQKYSSQYEVDDYIRKLREIVVRLKIQNDFLLKEESYLPLKLDHQKIAFNSGKKCHTDLEEVSIQYKAITITFDHKKFPQLIITPINHQQEYIEKVISQCIHDEIFNGVYGCFELQKNGVVHGHFIVPYYANELILYEKLVPYFTDRIGKQYAVLIKNVDNVEKWFEYMNKDEPVPPYSVRPKDKYQFIEYNICKRNTLDLE